MKPISQNKPTPPPHTPPHHHHHTTPFLPRPSAQGDYAIGQLFLPRDPELYETAKAAIHKAAVYLGNDILAWRKVPTDNRCGSWAGRQGDAAVVYGSQPLES